MNFTIGTIYLYEPAFVTIQVQLRLQ